MSQTQGKQAQDSSFWTSRSYGFEGAPIVLDLVLAHHWFDEVAYGRKRVEYREMTPKWERMIWERRKRIVAVRFRRGYSKRCLILPLHYVDVGPCPYIGWPGTYYRLHLGKMEVPHAV